MSDPHHPHASVDQAILTAHGMRALLWSVVGMLLTAVLQLAVVWISGSVSLLADTLHNFGDAATAIPLWIAFRLAGKQPNDHFTYGYARVEDFAGLAVVLAIFSSAIMAGTISIRRFFHPQSVDHLGAVAAASVIGFLGNEAVAIFRIKAGKKIGSEALVADGYHARVDGLTSLAVLFGAAGVALGYPMADPLVGIVIAAVILGMTWTAARGILERFLDAVDPLLTQTIRKKAAEAAGVLEVTEVRVRWVGHQLHAEVNVAVDSHITVAEGHSVSDNVRERLLHGIDHLGTVTIHVDPQSASGERHHHTH